MAQLPDIRPPGDVPAGPLAWLKAWLQDVRLWVQTREPNATLVGNPTDKFTTRGELIDAGLLLRTSDGRFTRGVGSIPGPKGDPGPQGDPGVGVTAPDLTPPPTPTGLAVTGLISNILIEWDAPVYTQGRGNDLTLVYGAIWLPGDAQPTFGDVRTKLINTAAEATNILAHPSNPNTTWCIWIKFKTRDGVEGTQAGGTHGVQATTGQDVASLLQVLAGEITAEQLYVDLQTPIGSILTGQDEAAEAALAATLAAHDANAQRAAELLIEAQDRGAAIVEESTTRQTAEESLAQSILTLTAATLSDQAAAAAALEVERTVRAEADEAEALERTTLAAQLRGDYAGTDVDAITTGLLYEERAARVSADGAQVTRLEGLEASVDTPGTGLLARATALEATTVDIGNDLTAVANRTTLLEASVDTPSTGLLARATALETVTTAAGSGNSALASRATALESTVNNGVTGVAATAAALDIVETLVNDGTDGVVATASRVDTLFTKVDSPTIGNNATYAALQTEATTRASETGALFAQYTVKIDLNGYLSGYGLTSSLSSGGTPTSLFIVSVDKFAVATPASAVTAWAGTTAYALNAIRGISGVDDKLLVCKQAGTSGSSAPSIAGAIGSMVTDGSVRWQIASRVPFAVLTTPTTINGVSVPAGVYIDAAYVLNATIQNAQLANLSVDDQKVASVSVAKLTAGSISVGEYIQSTGYVAGSAGWRINGNGTAEFSGVIVRGTIYAQAADIQGQISASQINAFGLTIYKSDGTTIVLDADADSPPWVTASDIIESADGASILAPITTDNTRRLRNLTAGPGIDTAVSADDQSVVISALASEVAHVRRHADAATSSATLSNIDGMAFALLASSTYIVRGTLVTRSAASATGLKLHLTAPAGATGAAMFHTESDSGGVGQTRTLDIPTDSGVTFLSTRNTGGRNLLTFEALINTAGVAGNVQLQLATETSSVEVEVLAGSAMTLSRMATATSATTINLASSTLTSYASTATATAKPSTATLTLTFKRDGTWAVTSAGSTSHALSGTPATGDWASPTNTDAGVQWEIKFIPGSISTTAIGAGTTTTSNGATDWQPLTAQRSYAITVSCSVAGERDSSVAVEVQMRRISSGAVTTFDTVTIAGSATSL